MNQRDQGQEIRQKSRKIKPSLNEFFALRPGVTLDKINGKMTQKKQKSSKAQPSPNEVFALRYT
jgi:hypothetical protein